MQIKLKPSAIDNQDKCNERASFLTSANEVADSDQSVENSYKSKEVTDSILTDMLDTLSVQCETLHLPTHSITFISVQ